MFNRHSGPPRQRDLERELRGFKKAFTNEGIRIHTATFDGHGLPEALEQAREARPDLLIAAGGDGTVNAVAGLALTTDTPLAVLPMGTLNHFARDLGMPLEPMDAIKTIAKVRPRRVDVAEVNGRPFLNNSSIGVYPRLVRKREELRGQHGEGKFLATARAGVSILKRHPSLDVQIQTPAGAVETRTPFVFVGNNAYDLDFFVLGRRQRLDTGQLSLYYSRRHGRAASLRLALRSLIGRLDQDDDFEALAAPTVTIRSRRRSVRVAFDGEIRRLEPPLHYRSRPKALRVHAPGARRRKPA